MPYYTMIALKSGEERIPQDSKVLPATMGKSQITLGIKGLPVDRSGKCMGSRMENVGPAFDRVRKQRQDAKIW